MASLITLHFIPMIDIIGQIFWFAAFGTPLVTIPLVWRDKSMSKAGRILLGLLISLVLSAVFIGIAMAIATRSGLGHG
jgi:hypothetical protein